MDGKANLGYGVELLVKMAVVSSLRGLKKHNCGAQNTVEKCLKGRGQLKWDKPELFQHIWAGSLDPMIYLQHRAILTASIESGLAPRLIETAPN